MQWYQGPHHCHYKDMSRHVKSCLVNSTDAFMIALENGLERKKYNLYNSPGVCN